jgi:hypothetical protein
MSLSEVLRDNTVALMKLPGVIGTAEGHNDGDPCVLVLVIELTDKLEAMLPTELGGYKVKITVTGSINAQ